MSSRFVVVSFLGLGWTFYELSGGADFAPPERPEVVAEAAVSQPEATRASVVSAAGAQTVETARNSKEVLPEPLATRPAADPALREQVAREQLIQAGSALSSSSAFDSRVPTGGLQLVSLEGGLSAITTEPVTPIVTPVERPVVQTQDIRYVRASRVNMRQGPGTNYSVLTRLLANDKVIVLEDSGTGWLRLKVEDNGRVGWIAASLLTKKAP